MINNTYEKIIKIRYSELNHDLMLKPSALLQFLEDLASENAEQFGFGYSFVRKHNLAWFLLKYHMEFYSYPKGIIDLRIKTEARGYNKLFAFRDFELYEGETLLAKVVSTWSLVDLTTKTITPINKVLVENPHMQLFEKRETDISYAKIKPITNPTQEKSYEIRYDDIDVNGHANNSNYIIWGFEPLDFDFRTSHRLKTLDMVFKKEIQYGNSIISQVEIEPDLNQTYHVVKSQKTNEDLCLIGATWTDK